MQILKYLRRQLIPSLLIYAKQFSLFYVYQNILSWITTTILSQKLLQHKFYQCMFCGLMSILSRLNRSVYKICCDQLHAWFSSLICLPFSFLNHQIHAGPLFLPSYALPFLLDCVLLLTPYSIPTLHGSLFIIQVSAKMLVL